MSHRSRVHFHDYCAGKATVEKVSQQSKGCFLPAILVDVYPCKVNKTLLRAPFNLVNDNPAGKGRGSAPEGGCLRTRNKRLKEGNLGYKELGCISFRNKRDGDYVVNLLKEPLISIFKSKCFDIFAILLRLHMYVL